jgi:4-pyridoxate dehydrogenase
MAAKSYDYVIVGAGSAGCTLARRLTENPATRVLLLEAGGWDRDPWIKIPIGWGRILEKRLHDWMYFTEPEAALDGRRIECARGKVIGGSSSINAMAYVRGNKGDYDRWAKNGCTGWSYVEVLPYFRRQESWEGGGGEFRGGDGPLTVQTSTFTDTLIEACLASGAALQMPLTPDYNGAQQEGLGRMQQTIRKGRRCSAAEAYLRPALRRPNLTVETGALANRVVLEGERAVGIEYVRGDETLIAEAEREVILSGGVINSPQLLMLSGIGDPDRLAEHGIACAVPLPGVGRNLQDHLSVLADFARADQGPFVETLRFDRIVTALAQAYCLGTGPAAETPSGWTGFVKSRPDVELPDIQFLFRAVATKAALYWPFTTPYPDGFSLRAVMLRPESRGEIALASADPRAPVRIRQNFLATDNDKRTIRDGLKLVRRMAQTPPLSAFVANELAPGPAVQSDDALDSYIRATAATAHHPLGTCKMGPGSDPMAVVNPALQVYDVAGLRVVDASIMPDLVGGNINAPVIMIAEKAADMIRGRAPLLQARLPSPKRLTGKKSARSNPAWKYAPGAREIAMKTALAAVTLLMTVSAALAEAPWENPSAPQCQKACALMGAKFALSMREQALKTQAQILAVQSGRPAPRVDLTSFDNDATLGGVRYLAQIAGRSLHDINGMTLREARHAVEQYCPQQPR